MGVDGSRDNAVARGELLGVVRNYVDKSAPILAQVAQDEATGNADGWVHGIEGEQIMQDYLGVMRIAAANGIDITDILDDFRAIFDPENIHENIRLAPEDAGR